MLLFLEYNDEGGNSTRHLFADISCLTHAGNSIVIITTCIVVAIVIVYTTQQIATPWKDGVHGYHRQAAATSWSWSIRDVTSMMVPPPFALFLIWYYYDRYYYYDLYYDYDYFWRFGDKTRKKSVLKGLLHS